MIIIPQSFDLLFPEREKKLLDQIEYCGRVFYKSETKGDPAGFVKRLIDNGHESVLEHASISAEIVTDRAIAQELTRHRIASYTMESTRYVRYKDGLTVIRPPFLHGVPGWTWESGVKYAEEYYGILLGKGVSPEIARSVLPLCLACDLAMTANVRQWRHILKQRLEPAAHPQMRELMEIALDEFVRCYPVLFKDIAAEVEE